MSLRAARLLLIGIVALAPASRSAADIYGTLSNFDVYNETGEHCYGAELELEGIHASDVYGTFPTHFNNKIVTEYQNGATFGTRITYSGYNFNSLGYLESTMGQSTNGHMCVDTSGCEHFGFSTVGAQPTASRYYWLDQAGQRIGAAPMAVPTPTWTYVPAVNGGQPDLRAEVEVPHAEVEAQKPDSIWIKVYKTELDRPVDLMELMSNNAVVPEDAAETETEWELLEGGKVDGVEDKVGHGKESVIRRYEYFEYTGAYNGEHEPLSPFLNGDLATPPEGELGQFIAANMVAANLAAPLNPQQGDFNGDGAVDGADLLAWQRHKGDNDFPAVDEDHNGRVDGNDLAAWRADFGVEHEQGGLAAVPEPAPGILAIAGLLAIAAHRTCLG